MTLVKWNNRNKAAFPSIFDEFGSSMFKDPYWADFETNKPAVNIKEGETSFTVEVAAPGFDKQDFNIELNDKTLTISSEKEAKNETENEKFTRREFSYSSFKRSFSLPDNVDGDKITAAYDSGVLNIEIPKKKEAIKKLKEIKVA